MNNKKPIITKIKLVIILIVFIVLTILNNIASAATHEIGLGASIVNKNDKFNNCFGFDIHYDYSPNKFLILRTAVNGDFLNGKNNEASRDGYWDDFYLNRESLSEKPGDSYFILSIEESIIYKTTVRKFEPYMGIGLSFYLVNHYMGKYDIDEKIENSLGLNFRGGVKYPIAHKLFTYIEAKYVTPITKTDISSASRYLSDGYNVTGSRPGTTNLDMNKLQLHAGLSFGL